MSGFEIVPKLWQTRLEVMRDVFSWITPAIKELAGLHPTDDLSSPESAADFIVQHDDCMLGTMSSNPKVGELHRRQNAEWEQITGIGPLGSPSDWRAAGHAAGAPAGAIARCDVEVLARFITPWAIAKRSASDTATDQYSRIMAKADVAKLLGISKRTLTRRIADGKLRYLDNEKRTIRIHLGDLPK